MTELYHHGILGQKWGIRRYQNDDGSLTPEGRKRYYGSNGKLTDEGKKAERKAMNKYKADINKAHENALRNGDEKFANAALKYEYTWSKKTKQHFAKRANAL